MSKATLKKELQNFDREQLVELILSSYDSSKEAKDFYEFFINPDPNKLFEDKLNVIIKEMQRTRRGGYSKGRVSIIRNTIKTIAGYGVGAEMHADFILSTIRVMAGLEKYYYYSDTQMNAISRLVEDYLSVCNSGGMLQKGIDEIDVLTRDEVLARSAVRSMIKLAANTALEKIAAKEATRKP